MTGSGSVNSPYTISSALNLAVMDSATIDLSMTGDGSPSEPYLLSASANVALEDITNVTTTGAATGNVLARQADGTWAPAPASTAPVGAISVGNGIEGDGSGGNPLKVKLAPSSGLTLSSSGLAVAGSSAWQNYTPVLSSSSVGNITLDAGSSLTGRYRQDGKTVYVNIQLTLSANFSAPSGRYRISLPVADRAGLTMRQMIPLSGFFTDDGSDPGPNEWRANRIGFGGLEGTGRIERIYVDRGGYSSPVGQSYPRWRAFAIRMTFSGFYEAD